MSNLQVAVYQPTPAFNPQQPSPFVKRTAEVTASLLGGACAGYMVYWITRLFDKVGMFGVPGTNAIHPLPYILVGISQAALIEGACLTYDAALCVLGNRADYENLADPENASAFDRLRQRSWKVIGRIEKVPHDVDVVFSRVFGIRTAQELRDKNLADCNPAFMEIARRAFWEQVDETARQAIPQELAVCLVEALGYTVLGGHLFIWLHALNFVFGLNPPNPFSKDPLPPNSGLINRIGRVYKQMELNELAQRRQRLRELENKAYCDILAAMYPVEFAELDAQEDGIHPENMQAEREIDDIENVEEELIFEENEDIVDMFENNDFFVRPSSDFDLDKHRKDLAYRCTAFHPNNIPGLPIREDDNDGNPLIPENVPLTIALPLDSQQTDLFKNLAFVK